MIAKCCVKAAAQKTVQTKILIRMEAMEKMAQNQETTILIIKEEALEHKLLEDRWSQLVMTTSQVIRTLQITKEVANNAQFKFFHATFLSLNCSKKRHTKLNKLSVPKYSSLNPQNKFICIPRLHLRLKDKKNSTIASSALKVIRAPISSTPQNVAE